MNDPIKIQCKFVNGDVRVYHTVVGKSITDVLRDNGIAVKCGLDCRVCRVKIGARWNSKLPMLTQKEKERMRPDEIGLRLGCCIQLTSELNGLEVTVLIMRVCVTHQNGDKKIYGAADGETLLHIAERNQLARELPCSCGGSRSCATCHVILPPDWFAKANQVNDIDAKILDIEAERDMLEHSKKYNQYSRLGCQIRLRKNLDLLEVATAYTEDDV